MSTSAGSRRTAPFERRSPGSWPAPTRAGRRAYSALGGGGRLGRGRRVGFWICIRIWLVGLRRRGLLHGRDLRDHGRRRDDGRLWRRGLRFVLGRVPDEVAAYGHGDHGQDRDEYLPERPRRAPHDL